MVKLSYDETYNKLKEKGWDDERITKALTDSGLYPNGGGQGGQGGQGGGGGNSDSSDIPDVKPEEIITEYQTPKNETKNYDETKAEEGALKFNELAGEPDDTIDESFDYSRLSSLPMIVQAIAQGGGKEGVKKAITSSAGYIGKLLGKGAKFVTRNAGAIATGIISAAQTADDRKSGKVKSEYKGDNGNVIDDFKDPNYRKDAGRNFYSYTDNTVFGLLPNIDSVYNNTKSSRKEQAEQMKKNEEVKDVASQVKNYYKEIDKANADKSLGNNAGMEAERQLSKYFAKVNKLDQDEQNTFKKNLIKEGYRVGKAKDKNGNTVTTWIDKDGKPLFTSLSKAD